MGFAVEQAEREYAVALASAPGALECLRSFVRGLEGKPVYLVRQAFRGGERGWMQSLRSAVASPMWAERLPALRLHRRALDALADALPSRPSSEADRAALRRARAAADRARSALVHEALPVARAMANKYRRRGVDTEDLVQEATIGLMRAADRFDPRSGFRFEAYAAWWARQQIQRALVEHARTIRVPLHVVQATQSVRRAERTFSARHGRKPTAAEVFAANVAESTFLLARDIVEEPLRLDFVGLDGESLGAQVPDLQAERADDALASAQLGVEMGRHLQRLSARQREVLKLRYGLDGSREHSLQEIGERLGVSRERVRRIQVSALDALGTARTALRPFRAA